MDEKAKEILSGIIAKQSKSKLYPHRDLILKLRQRNCSFREIASILFHEYGLEVGPNTVCRFVKRMEIELSKPKKTRAREEKPVQAMPTEKAILAKPMVPEKPVPVKPVSIKTTPQSDEIRQRIASFKQQKVQPKADNKAFDYDPEEPLTIVRK